MAFLSDEANQEKNVKPSDILKKYRARMAKEASTSTADKDTKMSNITDSLAAINILSISLWLIRAKHAFKKKISMEPVRAEDISNQVEKHWEDIEKTSVLKFKLDDTDLSDLYDILPPSPSQVEDKEDPKSCIAHCENGTVIILPLASSPHAPPTPPPPPPPPPPVLKKCHEIHKELTINPKNEIKLVKLHWKPLQVVSHDSLWSNLPHVNIKIDELNHLFQIKERKTSRQEAVGKPKEILVLDPKRSNQINIGIKKLPILLSLKNVILKMDDQNMKREGIEKLQSLIGSTEEIEMIKEAQRNNPDVPLGHAEQFLLILDSISDLDCRLKLWAFKLDFAAIETEILEAMKSLKEGSKKIKENKIFLHLMSFTRDIGNYLNKSRTDGFQLDYLSKLGQVKDTSTRKSLLFHINAKAVESGLETDHLLEQFGCLNLVCQTDYEKIKLNLKSLEEDCTDSLAFVKLASYDNETFEMVNDFLQYAAHKILAMRKVTELVLADFSNLLEWFGIPGHIHSEYTPMTLAQILTNFA